MTCLYVYMVWTVVGVGLVSAGSEFAVSGHVGSTVILPCEKTETLYIRWQIHSKVVFERVGKERYEGKGYEGRVDVPEDELRKGDCSLVLNNLTLNDTAVYTSYQIVTRTKRAATKANMISRVNLSVRPEKPEEDRLLGDSGPKGDSSMKCPHTLILILSLVSSLHFLFYDKR